MIKFASEVISLALVASLTGHAYGAGSDCGTTWTCGFTADPPTLDADHSEWENVEGITTALNSVLTRKDYTEGMSTYKCMYDDDHIYLALEIPGDYRFNSTDNRYCAAIATMMKIGTEATFLDMGGCPDAPVDGCAESSDIPDTCDAYRVDIGAHWELKGTKQGVLYPINATGGTGNDLVANKDDEYAVNSFCRFDDDGTDAGNEWAGAWAHTNPVDGEAGVYKFELSRLLKTKSSKTDTQMTPGETYSFGIAYWDPYEGETGWSKIGHFVTGCGTKWIDLELAKPSAGVIAIFSAASWLTAIAAVAFNLW